MTRRMWCAYCRRNRMHRCNGIGMWICAACGGWKTGAVEVKDTKESVTE